MTADVRIALLGLGEAGGEIARDLVAAGADVRGYDPRVVPEHDVPARGSEADAVSDADLVLSVNSAADAMVAVENALPGLRPGTIWADLNTAAPRLKAGLVDRLDGHDVSVADVALMAPVPGQGLRTPMLVSGDGSARFAEIVADLGGDVTVQDGPAGAAITRKLLRSVFYKGLAAAVVEALDAARAAGCEEWLHDHIRAELAGFDDGVLDRLVAGTHRHAGRRVHEMAAAAEQLTDLGVAPRVATAARDLLIALTDAEEDREVGGVSVASASQRHRACGQGDVAH